MHVCCYRHGVSGMFTCVSALISTHERTHTHTFTHTQTHARAHVALGLGRSAVARPIGAHLLQECPFAVDSTHCPPTSIWCTTCVRAAHMPPPPPPPPPPPTHAQHSNVCVHTRARIHTWRWPSFLICVHRKYAHVRTHRRFHRFHSSHGSSLLLAHGSCSDTSDNLKLDCTDTRAGMVTRMRDPLTCNVMFGT